MVEPYCPVDDLSPLQCIALWSSVLSTQFGGLRAFLSNLTSGWPQLTPAWPLIPSMYHTPVRVLPTKFGSHWEFLNNFTPCWSRITSAWPSIPAMHYTSVRDSSNQIGTGGHMIISKVDWPLDDIWPLVGSLVNLNTYLGPIPYQVSARYVQALLNTYLTDTLTDWLFSFCFCLLLLLCFVILLLLT